MIKSEGFREVATSHFKNGKKAPEIAKLLADEIHRTTIHRWLREIRKFWLSWCEAKI